MFKKYNIFLLIICLCFTSILFGCKKEDVYYNVTINLNEAGDESTEMGFRLISGSKLTEPELPRVAHHQCVGFYDGDKLWDFEKDVVKSDLILVAKWEETVLDYELVIDEIEKIDSTNYESLKKVRDMYEALSETNKKYVNNYRKLYNAEIDYFNSEVEKASSFEELDELFELIKSFSADTLVKLGDDIKGIYNKRFELTYAEKVRDANLHQQEVVKAVGNAFLYKNVYNQYDQTRRVAGSSPYDASEYDTLYLDCSAFCYSVYTYVFGSAHHVNLNTASNETYAKTHQDSSEVVYYVDTTKYKTAAEKQALLDEIYSNLQVGDLINYRHGTSSGTAGHVVMYIGNGTIIHSTGDDMGASEYSSNPELFREVQTTTEASIGTVFTFEASQMFKDSTSSRYLFKSTSSDTVWSFAVIRPLANQMTISDKALSNYLLADVDITKTSSVGARTSVKPGEVVTYTITLTNHSNASITNIPIYKEVPKQFEYIESSDNGLYIENAGIVYSVDLKPNETKNVTCKLKVKEDTKIGMTVTDGVTYVHNIYLPSISNSVIKDVDMSTFFKSTKDLMDSITYTNVYDFINDAYKDYIPGGIVDIFSDENKETTFINSKNCIVPDMTKGTKVKRVLAQYLEPGDIISYYNQKTNKYTTYLYLREDLMVSAEDGKYIKIDTRYGIQSVLDKLFAMNKYTIVRPLMKE